MKKNCYLRVIYTHIYLLSQLKLFSLFSFLLYARLVLIFNVKCDWLKKKGSEKLVTPARANKFTKTCLCDWSRGHGTQGQ